jgi:dolichyl-diphosphooligosaccharide---protein glycosyltransferase
VEKNRICDAPGSWFCRGQYPPALTKILKEKKDFKQLEDFNVKDGGDDSEYQKKYFENLNKAAGPGSSGAGPKEVKQPKLSEAEIDMINEEWQNTDATTLLHNIIEQDDGQQLAASLQQEPRLAHIRSEDGRGPMFWAHEYGRKKIVRLFKMLGVSETRTDANGKTPLDSSKI